MLGSVEKIAPEYGYFLNASKTKPSIKRGLCRACFLWKSITILAEGLEILACPIGTKESLNNMFSKSQMDGYVSFRDFFTSLRASHTVLLQLLRIVLFRSSVTG